jgi:hypothetical protein
MADPLITRLVERGIDLKAEFDGFVDGRGNTLLRGKRPNMGPAQEARVAAD